MARFTGKQYLEQVKALFEGAEKALPEADYAAFVEDAETFIQDEAAAIFEDEDEDDAAAEDEADEDEDEDEDAPEVPEE